MANGQFENGADAEDIFVFTDGRKHAMRKLLERGEKALDFVFEANRSVGYFRYQAKK